MPESKLKSVFERSAQLRHDLNNLVFAIRSMEDMPPVSDTAEGRVLSRRLAQVCKALERAVRLTDSIRQLASDGDTAPHADVSTPLNQERGNE